jgi:hypothetical protein
MNEKQQIERATVDAFITLYNELHDTSYSVREYGDAPDAVCESGSGDDLNVEVCITEDRPGDIPWALGKVSSRPSQSRIGSCLSGNALQQLAERLKKKSLMRYGERCALVIRDSSGVDWDWEELKTQVKAYLEEYGNPFDMGIWIVNRTKTRLHRIA